MITVSYSIHDSRIPGAGKGLFIQSPVPAGRVIVVPSGIPDACVMNEMLLAGQVENLQATSVRWFENVYTVDPDWTDESFINHSFLPNGLWHMGFVFAARDLEPGEELTVDYRLFIKEGETLPFPDALTGAPITGLSWPDSLEKSLRSLLRLVDARERSLSV